MRIPLARFRPWQMMSIIALSALCITGYRLWSLSRACFMKAQSYQRSETLYRATYENELLNLRELTKDAILSRERAKNGTRHSPPGSIFGGTVEGDLRWANICEGLAAQHSISARADRTRLDSDLLICGI